MKIADILNIQSADLRKMNIKQLEKIVQQAERASERRLKALEQKDLTLVSPAYQFYESKLRNNQLSQTKKNRLRLIADLRANQRFLSTDTSLVKGARKHSKKMQKLLPNVAQKDYAKFWDAVNNIRKTNAVRFSQLSSGAIISALQDAWDASKSFSQNLQEMTRIYENEYERSNARLKGNRPDPDKYRV